MTASTVDPEQCMLHTHDKSGNAKRTDNPTVYRTPAQYHKMVIDQVSDVRSESGMPYYFELVSQKTVTAYVQAKGNHNQIAWLYRKTTSASNPDPRSGMALQAFLDKSRYTPEIVRAYGTPRLLPPPVPTTLRPTRNHPCASARGSCFLF